MGSPLCPFQNCQGSPPRFAPEESQCLAPCHAVSRALQITSADLPTASKPAGARRYFRTPVIGSLMRGKWGLGEEQIFHRQGVPISPSDNEKDQVHGHQRVYAKRPTWSRFQSQAASVVATGSC